MVRTGKKIALWLMGLVTVISLLESSDSFARDRFRFQFACIDNGYTHYTQEMYEVLTTETHYDFSQNDRSCDTVCVTLVSNQGMADSLSSMALKRYRGDIDDLYGDFELYSNYGEPDSQSGGSSWARYCWADWTDNYWSTYLDACDGEIRKTELTFRDGDNVFHKLTIVPVHEVCII